MCGIVGYIGHREAYPVILNGLRRLEYRGYDSAGLALCGPSGFDYCKTKGKVADLEKKCVDLPKTETMGMGHTRWATHGEPNEINSHPHFSNSGDLCIIHNGIVENHDTLRQELIERGYHFKSETDTEVLINLIEEIKEQEGVKLGKAVQLALKYVVGRSEEHTSELQSRPHLVCRLLLEKKKKKKKKNIRIKNK